MLKGPGKDDGDKEKSGGEEKPILVPKNELLKLQLQRRRVGSQYTDNELGPVPKSQRHMQLKGSFPACCKGWPGLIGRHQWGDTGPDLCQDSPCPPSLPGEPPPVGALKLPGCGDGPKV